MIEFEYKNHKVELEGYDFHIDNESISYISCIKLLNPQIKWHYDEIGDYQGDWFAIGKDNKGQWWFHQGSYGSCSGCDWLQGITTKDEAIEFLQAMEKIIKIGNTKEEAIIYLKNEQSNLWEYAKEELDKLIEYIKKKV